MIGIAYMQSPERIFAGRGKEFTPKSARTLSAPLFMPIVLLASRAGNEESAVNTSKLYISAIFYIGGGTRAGHEKNPPQKAEDESVISVY